MATITSPRTHSPANNVRSPSIAETSSTRGSFDLNPNARSSLSAGPSAQQPPTARRGNRAALREFYNLKNKPTTPRPGYLSRTASITSTSSDVTSATLTDFDVSNSKTSALTAPLDAETFDAEAYISNLLAGSSLRDILKVEATLVSEIRNLDGDRKALVYDNYSKLISAVGTIGAMQRSMNEQGGGLSEVGELEGKIEKLRTSVREITGVKSDEQVKSEEAARKQRRELKNKQQKQDLVKWVLDAPNRLKKLIEEDKDEEAEKEWDNVKKYLDAWEGVKGVEKVKKACEDVMQQSELEDDNDDANQDD